MPNHIHFIAEDDELGEKIRLFKSYSAKQILEHLKSVKKQRILNTLKDLKLEHKKGRNYQVWQEGYHPKCIFDDWSFERVLDYIHNNPVAAGYIEDARVWRYSSARDYYGSPGLIPLTLYRS